MDLTWIFFILAVLLALAYAYAKYMSSNHGVFQKMGIDNPPTSFLLGNLGQLMKLGLFDSLTMFYNQYKDKKVYGWHDRRTPILIIRDLDIVKEVMVKKFNYFVNRRQLFELEPPLRYNMLNLRDGQWKHVRSAVSPTFSSGRIKKMFGHLEKQAKILIDHLYNKQERNEEIELKVEMSKFTMNAIASIGFGLEIDSFKDPENQFSANAQRIMSGSPLVLILALICPPLMTILMKLKAPLFRLKEMKLLTKIVDAAIESRKDEGQAGQFNDFLDLLINAEDESDDSMKTLSREEIHGQALIFIVAGLETVSTVLSFTLFLIATHPEVRQKVHDEIDHKIGREPVSYDNIQGLTYLDMCINESLRLFPPAALVERQCNEETEIQGIHIPKDMAVMIPIYAIHHDSDLWPEPEKFDPERFSPESKASYHPFAHLPFGQGPRNCIGMRLAQMELKVAIASILQKLTPVTCSKTVYPIQLEKAQTKAKDGLWVKMDRRK